MSMSKQDFVALAEAMIEARAQVAERASIQPGDNTEETLIAAAERIADVCAKGNPRFDRERFLRAALLGDFSVPKRTRKTAPVVGA